jgi:YfiH family protein
MNIEIFKNYPVKSYFSKRINGLEELNIKPFIAVQKHTDKIFLIKEKSDTTNRPIADALITNLKKIPIGVKTADCVPLLMYDIENNVIAAVHSGWKGTAQKIAVKTIKKMTEVYKSKPQNILIAVGPSICGRCYSVGKDVIEEFKKIISYDFYIKKDDRFFIDLKEINKNLLKDAGVEEKNIFIHPDCTYCKNEEYQSYRYHKNTLSFQISYIMIE